MVSSLGFTLSFEQGLTWFDLHFKTPTWVAMERTDWGRDSRRGSRGMSYQATEWVQSDGGGSDG